MASINTNRFTGLTIVAYRYKVGFNRRVLNGKSTAQGEFMVRIIGPSEVIIGWLGNLPPQYLPGWRPGTPGHLSYGANKSREDDT